MTQSIRRTGLKKHLGTDRYKELAHLEELDVPLTVIMRAFKVTRPTAEKYRAIYHEELQKVQD
jgi:hypothetical protein